MNTKEIIENNKLIAEFMGAEKRNNNVYEIYNFPEKTKEGFKSYDVIYLEYHSSWDWLMPVVEKIESLEIDGFHFVFTMTTCNIYFEHSLILDNSYIVQVERTENMMNDIYIAVIEFIKWYNKNN